MDWTYHGHIVSIALHIHLGPVTFVFLCERTLTAVGLVAIETITAMVTPTVKLQCHFIIMAVTVAGLGCRPPATPCAVVWVWRPLDRTTQLAVVLSRASVPVRASTWLRRYFEEARFAMSPTSSDIAIWNSCVLEIERGVNVEVQEVIGFLLGTVLTSQ